jgi:hypothetical protein
MAWAMCMGRTLAILSRPTTNSTVIAIEPVSGKCCGALFPPAGVNSPGRVVFLSFPLDAVPETGPTPDNETALLLNVLKFPRSRRQRHRNRHLQPERIHDPFSGDSSSR